MSKEEITYENVTPEQLVEFFGGIIIEEDGHKTWEAPVVKKQHPDFVYRIIGNTSKDIGQINVIAKPKI